MSEFVINPGIFGTNYVLHKDDFYISYAPDPGEMVEEFVSDNDGDETALVYGNKFYILNGDFRTEYSKLADEGYEACKKFFDDNQDKKSTWSN